MPEATLEFLAEQMKRVLTEVASLRDDMRVNTAMVLRIDGTLNRMLDEVHEMHAQHARFNDRLRTIEEAR
jgi:hypothetical protein